MIAFKVNGKDVSVEDDGETALLWVLREELGLTGTKYGCGIARCGACTVIIEGVATRSCVTPVSAAAGKELTTIEGLGTRDKPHPVQDAWMRFNVPQCGYCQSGQIMSATALLQAKPKCNSDEIDTAMAGNLCRCGTYPRIKKAILSLAGE